MSKQKRQHKFFDNHTIPGVIALMFAGRFPLGPVPLSSIGVSLMAGISEEIAFRELPISYLARQWREEKLLPVYFLIYGYNHDKHDELELYSWIRCLYNLIQRNQSMRRLRRI